MTTKMSQQLVSHFSPTHEHTSDGVLYEVLDYPRVKVVSGLHGVWVNGVLYRNKDNVLCVRTAENFNQRFTKL